MIVAGVPLAVFLVFLAFLVFLVVFVFAVGAGVGGLGDGLLSRWGLPARVRFPLPSAFPVFWVFGFSGSQGPAVGGDGGWRRRVVQADGVSPLRCPASLEALGVGYFFLMTMDLSPTPQSSI